MSFCALLIADVIIAYPLWNLKGCG